MVYIIPKGSHYSRPCLKAHFYWGASVISKTVLFDASCRYEGDAQLREQWNKLFGIATFPFLPHRNSLRLAWRYNSQKDGIDIAQYDYFLGHRYIREKAFVQIGVPTPLIIESTHRIYGFALYPYFGGLEAAPHDIIIDLS